jgi:hypothetical protein
MVINRWLLHLELRRACPHAETGPGPDNSSNRLRHFDSPLLPNLWYWQGYRIAHHFGKTTFSLEGRCTSPGTEGWGIMHGRAGSELAASC